jgi:hypothetical protein
MDEYCRINQNQNDAEHPADQPTGQPTGQATDQATESVKRVIMMLKGEMKNTEIMDALDLKHRVSFRENYLTPAKKSSEGITNRMVTISG